MGRMIRSAKIKLTTPPKLIPPLQSTAANGTLPMEQIKLTIATSGPTRGPIIFEIVGLLKKKKAFQNESGTQAANASAIRSPSAIYTSYTLLVLINAIFLSNVDASPMPSLESYCRQN